MKRSTKAALLSGLVFPGLGHMYLRRYIPGTLLSLGAASAFYFIVSVVVTTALEISEKIQGGNIPLDIGAITVLISHQLSGAERPVNAAMTGLAVLWVMGVADSYRLGRTMEMSEKRPNEKET